MNFVATQFIDGKVFQTERFNVQQFEGALEIEEIGNFVNQPDTIARAFFRIEPSGYKYVTIEFQQKGVALRAEAYIENVVRVFLNRELKIEQAITEPLILFDGPNPMFDVVNATRLLQLKDDETISKSVFSIDWQTGDLYTDKHIFTRNGNQVVINKGDEIGVSQFEFVAWNDKLHTYSFGKERFEFDYALPT